MKALIVVDVQNDFIEGGALAVAGGEMVAYNIASQIATNGDEYESIVFTMDFHNAWPDTNGGHFAADPNYVGTWPIHCVAGTHGAEIHKALRPYVSTESTFRKGQGQPHYSGFQGRSVYHTFLGGYLKARGIDYVDVVGLAGDHCVRATALDAVKMGLRVQPLSGMVASVGGHEATKAMMREVKEAQ